MSTTVVNITVPGAAIGAAAAGGEAADGPLGVFEAVMSAFFAGADGLIENPKPGAPFAVEGGSSPARHNLDVSKLPATAHPAKLAAAALSAPPAGDPAILPVAPAVVLVEGLVEAAAPEAAVAAPSPAGEPTTEDDGDAVAPAASDAAPVELAMLAQVPPPPAGPVEATAAVSAEGEGAAPTIDVMPPSDVEPPPPPQSEPVGQAVSEAAPKLGDEADKAEKPKAIPGANASDTARLHAAENSAVARAAALRSPAPTPAAPRPTAVEAPPFSAAATPPPPASPAPSAPPAAATELAALETQPQPPEPASPPAAAASKPADKPVRGSHAAPAVEAAPQDPAAPAQTAAPASESAATDKAPKLPAQAADAPRAQPAQPARPDEATVATPAEPSARAQAAAHSAPAEAAQVRGSPETVASLSAQIVKKLGARSTHFDVQLDPAGLGKVNVRVAINADGQVSAAMRFDNPQAAAELRSRAGELQRALAQSGFDLSGGLSFDVAQDQGGGYGGQQNAFFNDDSNNAGHAFRGRAFAAALETAGDAAQAALPGAFSPARGAPKGVDVRV